MINNKLYGHLYVHMEVKAVNTSRTDANFSASAPHFDLFSLSSKRICFNSFVFLFSGHCFLEVAVTT